MKDNKTILYIVLAFVAGAVIMGLIDANASKPLFSSADYSGTKEEMDIIGGGSDVVPIRTPYDLNNDSALTYLDIEIERSCAVNLGDSCSLKANDFNRDGRINSADVTIIKTEVFKVLYDLNSDGISDKSDIQIERDCVVGMGNQCSLIKNDFNNDGRIDSSDVAMISSYVSSNLAGQENN